MQRRPFSVLVASSLLIRSSSAFLQPPQRTIMSDRHRPFTELFASSSSSDTKVHRILCYGDSLTAGTSSPMWELFPYAPHLERALTTGDTALKCVARHRGMPGWLASNMVDAADDPTVGLRAAIQGITNPSLCCVIILAGTNDLGYAASGNDNPAATVLEPIKALHEMAWKEGVPKTIAIAIPPSGYQSRVADASFLAMAINQELEAFCQESNGKALFCKFPFEYEPAGDNCAPDGLHFSPKGYQVLGEYLKEPVLQVLKDL
ncbi:expressed unknown protein [Seminavis robusta]|uniref:SGNH hydrolase-type esterase domain-containing protein n=1 Tax=Seminavis robusta TaxID=568900 RepID=A0A9N8HJU6_9STRA|nr:expressed unknown protein [Seminavis robusta]|eukprot:Sro573_g169040.1 n/a (262) ;mRNA; r:38501-39286